MPCSGCGRLMWPDGRCKLPASKRRCNECRRVSYHSTRSFTDIAGQRFGTLVAIRFERGTPSKWVCLCDCGNSVSRPWQGLKAVKKNPGYPNCGGQAHKPAWWGQTCGAAEGCDREATDHGLCKKHWARKKAHGDDSVVLRRGGQRTANPTYKAAHQRIGRERGAASGFLCTCGRRARDWAYDYSDLNPYFEAGRSNSPYSTDTNRYIPLCKPCHRRFDVQHAHGHIAGGNGVWRIIATYNTKGNK